MVGCLALVYVAATQTAFAADNVVIQWDNALLQAIRDVKHGPPMVARDIAIVHTCIFDAWAAYDDVALGTGSGGALRRAARG